MQDHPVAVDQTSDLASKTLEALHRAIPKTRMIDYGVNAEDAVALDRLSSDGPSWEDKAEELANVREARARTLAETGQKAAAAQQLEWAAAALNIAQLAFNYDVPGKLNLLYRANALFAEAAALAGSLHERFVILGSAERDLFAWRFPVMQPRGCVIVLGGLSGWGMAYLNVARAFNLRGLAVLLIEGPGQGETRARSGLLLSRAAISEFGAVVEAAQALGGGRVGIMGNSFGGLIAAHVAAADARVEAVCINGAVSVFGVPEYRTAREQMEAVFAADGPALGARLAEFNFNPADTPIRQPVLIVEGGADPLLPVGAQAIFGRTTAYRCDVLTWADGEHTIYNHATDRNLLVGAWLLDQLEGGRA